MGMEAATPAEARATNNLENMVEVFLVFFGRFEMDDSLIVWSVVN